MVPLSCNCCENVQKTSRNQRPDGGAHAGDEAAEGPDNQRPPAVETGHEQPAAPAQHGLQSPLLLLLPWIPGL